MPASRAIEERFWEKVAIGAPDQCWLWTAGTVSDGAGMFYGAVRHEGKPRRAHVVSYILEHGEVPDGMCVCHTCDVPLCVNPAHLWLGTRGQNNADMVAKGRHVPRSFDHGTANPMTKVTPAMIAEIVTLHEQGWTYADIAVKLNISAATACRNYNKTRSAL